MTTEILPEDSFYVPLNNSEVSSTRYRYFAWNSKNGDRFQWSLIRECGP